MNTRKKKPTVLGRRRRTRKGTLHRRIPLIRRYLPKKPSPPSPDKIASPLIKISPKTPIKPSNKPSNKQPPNKQPPNKQPPNKQPPNKPPGPGQPGPGQPGPGQPGPGQRNDGQGPGQPGQPSTNKNVKEITTKEEFEAIIQGTGVVVVDFFMDGCPPCNRLAPQLEELSQTYPNVTIIKVNGVKYGAQFISGYSYNRYPTVVIYADGQKEKINGFQKNDIEQKIMEYINKTKPPAQPPAKTPSQPTKTPSQPTKTPSQPTKTPSQPTKTPSPPPQPPQPPPPQTITPPQPPSQQQQSPQKSRNSPKSSLFLNIISHGKIVNPSESESIPSFIDWNKYPNIQKFIKVASARPGYTNCVIRKARDNTKLVEKLKETPDLTAEIIAKEYLKNRTLYDIKKMNRTGDKYILNDNIDTFEKFKENYNDQNLPTEYKQQIDSWVDNVHMVKKEDNTDEEKDNINNRKINEVAKRIIFSDSPTNEDSNVDVRRTVVSPNKRDADYPVSTYEYTKGLHGPQPALYNKYFSYNEHDDSDDKNKKQFFDNLTNELGFTEEELLYKNEKGNKQYEVRLDQILDKINDSGKYDKISILDESCNPLNGREHISDNATSGGKTKKRTKSSAILTKKRKKNEK